MNKELIRSCKCLSVNFLLLKSSTINDHVEDVYLYILVLTNLIYICYTSTIVFLVSYLYDVCCCIVN